MDDRPFVAESINRQVNVQSEAVFSCAMALMGKIRGWEDEESWVGSKFAACMWIYTEEALTGGQILDREQEEYLRKRIKSNFELIIKKYHEVVKSAIMDAFVKPFSGERTPKSCMLTSVARVLRRTHKKRGGFLRDEMMAG